MTYIVRRLALMLPTLWLIMTLNFVLVQLAPGGPVEQAILRARLQAAGQLAGPAVMTEYRGGQGLTPEMIAELRQQYGFDQPLLVRYGQMLWQYAHLDLGDSLFRDQSVGRLIAERLPVSVSLGLWSTFMVYAIAIPLGIARARRPHGRFTHATTGLLALSYSVPGFVIGLVLLTLFAGGGVATYFPLEGLVSDDFAQLTWWQQIADYAWHLALPTLTLVLGHFAGLTYLVQYAILDDMGKLYVLAARAQGMTQRQVMLGEVLPNALLVVIAGLPEVLLAVLLGGNVLVEIIFGLDGMGLLAFEALQQRDYPVIFGTLLLYTLLGLVLRLLADILYHVIDPRIDFERWN